MLVRPNAGMASVAEEIAELERAGLQSVTLAESYTFDVVSQLGYLAARTETLELASGILPIYTRTPTLLAMTATGLDYVSNGRFRLGIGASGPQVIEGFHGLPFDAPLTRLRETIDVCRIVFRREKLAYNGVRYQIPVPDGGADARALKLRDHPVRDRIPITVAGTGEKTVELAAELAEAWEPIHFDPARVAELWGGCLDRGTARRNPALGPLQIVVRLPVAVGNDVRAEFEAARAQLALYIGGMGTRSRNFYNELAHRYGYGDEARTVQELYLSGRKDEATARIPDSLVEATTLIGPPSYVRDRLKVYEAAGVTLLTIQQFSDDPRKRRATVEFLRDLVD